jgi:tRNA (guanine-N7-)-methyltransferase
LKPGGRLYEVTDVKDLHDWNCSHLEQHQMFERVAEPVDDEGKQVTQK